VCAGAVTTTFSSGGELKREPEPTDGRRTVPASRSSAIAPAPSNSAIAGATTRRATPHTESHFARSVADTGLFLPFLDGPPRPRAER
jgi:hypothetical protein